MPLTLDKYDIIIGVLLISALFLIYLIYLDENLETFVTEEGKPLMEEIKRRNKIFVDYIYHKYKNSEKEELRTRAIHLYERYNPDVIREHFPSFLNKSTSYVENKGDEIGYCLKADKGKGKLEDINTMMYVSIHELTHIYLYDVNQHPTEFFANFKFLLRQAVDIGLYKPVDYRKKPVVYCGLELTSNVLYDL
jgi:hypothetical protein